MIKPAPILAVFSAILAFSLFVLPAQAAFQQGQTYYPGQQQPAPDVVPNSSLENPLYQFQKTIADEKDYPLEKLVGGGPLGGAPGILDITMKSIATYMGGTLGPITLADGRTIYNAGAIGATGNMIANLVNNPPVSTKEYLADIGSSLGLVKPAYAQTAGVGWQALTPILKIWQAFRNAAYLVFVLIFVVIGFMIMFRAKINPQTVISVQQAIPNLVITLILITFSYAIASLMIDMIYVLIYLGVGIFSLSGVFGANGPQLALNQLFNKSLMQLAFTDSGVFLGQADNNILEIIKGILGLEATAGSVQNIVQATIGGLADATLGILLYIVILFAVLFSMIKLLFQLLMSYVGIIISVIFAPFQLLFNAFPGSNGLVNWLKGLLANILVFPATAMMFLLARIVVGMHTNMSGQWVNDWGLDPNFAVSQGAVWQPPLLQVQPTQNAVAGLIGLGFILLTPKVVSMVKDMLKVEKGTAPMSYALGAILGVPGGVVGTPVNTMMQIAQARYYIMGGPKEYNAQDRSMYGGNYAEPSKGGTNQ